VLFLDEVGELELTVQAKLLRVLETREIMPLGASTPKAVDTRVCAATNRDLRLAVAEGRFRADLYFRLAQHEVHLPPLRERPEEIPRIVALALASVDPIMRPSARLIESCLRRSWPGNVRELLTEIRSAAHRAKAEGHHVVGADTLATTAGEQFAPGQEAPLRAASSAPPPPPGTSDPMRDAVLSEMDRQRGNVAGVARALGLHRTQLYRLMKKLGIGP
jgi:transcriptional regulator with GAF, ATPase, and Fis domain